MAKGRNIQPWRAVIVSSSTNRLFSEGIQWPGWIHLAGHLLLSPERGPKEMFAFANEVAPSPIPGPLNPTAHLDKFLLNFSWLSVFFLPYFLFS